MASGPRWNTSPDRGVAPVPPWVGWLVGHLARARRAGADPRAAGRAAPAPRGWRRRSRARAHLSAGLPRPHRGVGREQWQEMVHPDLLRARLDALDLVTSTLDRGTPKRNGSRSRSSPTRCRPGWACSTTSASCSASGSRSPKTVDDIDPSDPRAGGFAMYHWLTWLQGDLIEALLG